MAVYAHPLHTPAIATVHDIHMPAWPRIPAWIKSDARKSTGAERVEFLAKQFWSGVPYEMAVSRLSCVVSAFGRMPGLSPCHMDDEDTPHLFAGDIQPDNQQGRYALGFGSKFL